MDNYSRPLLLRYELGNLYIGLGAEELLAAGQAGKKIAVEIKSFIQNSAISEFYTALGQFISYRTLLIDQYAEHILYLAVPVDTYTSFFTTQLAQSIISNQKLKLIVYKLQQEVIERWLN